MHTGQHYDELLSDVFFSQLGLPEPDEYLGVGSGSHAQQTARLLEALEPVVCRHEPDAVLVPGDVNSTCAGALVAAKLNVPVVHLEAGLRSGDRSMPEEINRIVADHLSDLLLTTCADGDDNLLREGVAPEKIVDIGNTMIDSLVAASSSGRSHGRGDAQATRPGRRVRSCSSTLHRPSNVDEPGAAAPAARPCSSDVSADGAGRVPDAPANAARLADSASAWRSGASAGSTWSSRSAISSSLG